MSKAYITMFGKKKANRKQIQEFTTFRTPLGPDGKPVYVTEQGHKNECDVNLIIKKYDATGLITHVAKFEAMYGDVSALDFKQSMDLQTKINENFSELPSSIRKAFENSPQKYLKFLEDPKNEEKAIELGLRKAPSPHRANQEPKISPNQTEIQLEQKKG